MVSKEEKERIKKINSIKYSHNRITSESAQQNEEWELISNNHEDEKYTYCVFKRIGMKPTSTLWLHINSAGWTRVYLDTEYVKTLRTWKELNDLERVLFPGRLYYTYISPNTEEEKISTEEFLAGVKPIKPVHIDGYHCPF